MIFYGIAYFLSVVHGCSLLSCRRRKLCVANSLSMQAKQVRVRKVRCARIICSAPISVKQGMSGW
jgi:hypothetical protein